ncbi:MAG TPA: NADP-dependent malic enzyme [Aggregatilineales bacterium]|nr:NADP-dependent malic enzyme [Anaerolineales bacterium]HRE48181.1 NADP-dependent malic enzyme [Aggregatilineales bacterium]
MSITPEDVFEYHTRGRAGKIEVRPTKPLATQRDLSLAYSPGVAEVVKAIKGDPDKAFDYTARGNLVAVVSNGTAILGLGNLGALASKPVMEGKGVLFKVFADVDVFDIELDTLDPDAIIEICRALAPTFGGINLEDIRAPECFYIERRLREMLDIPVFHDDQHGTAIISSAALLNALRIVGKKIEDLKLVISGAGASAISTALLYIKLGMDPQNMLMVDSKGVIFSGRSENMNEYKAPFANDTDARTLEDALNGADMFLGLSSADIVTPHMLESMAERPILFTLANPDPEIKYELAREVRPDALIATGRSDLPNQVNNVLGFPFIFRGALDVRARTINEEMKLAAAYALAELTHEDVPDSVLNAYGKTSLKFSDEYLIPKPLDPRVLTYVAPAVAKAAMETGVARRQLDLDEYREMLTARRGRGQRFRIEMMQKAKMGGKKRVVFGEGEELKIIRAAAIIADEGIGQPILIGRRDVIREAVRELGLDGFRPQIVDPATSETLNAYTEAYYTLRQRRGVSRQMAEQALRTANVYGAMMVHQGDADVYISGLTYEYPEVIRPALQIFHTQPGVKFASGVYVMIANEKIYLFTDATVNIEPDAEQLAEIAILAADFAKDLDLTPRIAMLSFSNFGSTHHPLSNKVRDAVTLVRKKRPDLVIDGEVQADVAVSAEMMVGRFPFSRVMDANVLVFPDLESANTAYKLLSSLGGAQAIGPVLLGIGAPVHVLQNGDSVDDIVAITSVAVMDAHNRTIKKGFMA